MLSRRSFLLMAAGAGLGGMALATRHSFFKAEAPMAHPSDAVVFYTVRNDGLAHL
jgi:hypothetical protein